ncbi:MAG: hypothetical protein CR991_02500 [Proteobacteria bacterium]|nr:MAG: hypothetical protein CR991_02500 [Pseudomonadota bacterium]
MARELIEVIPAGAVLSKRGKVTATRAGQEARILKRGDLIYADDTVSTVRGANLQLRMKDRNIVMLRGGSSFRVGQYQPEAQLGEVKRFDYTGGELRLSRRSLSHS